MRLRAEKEAEHRRAGHVDGERAPREHAVVPGLDQPVGEISGGCAEHAAGQHCEDDHDWVPPA